MEKEKEILPTAHLFNEPEWLRVLFALNDLNKLVQEQMRTLMYVLPVNEKRKFRRKDFFLEVTAICHIIEKHYHKIDILQQGGKFTVGIPEIMELIRDASNLKPQGDGASNYYRTATADHIIGIDIEGKETDVYTVVTEPGGKIVTAFPGVRGKAPVNQL